MDHEPTVLKIEVVKRFVMDGYTYTLLEYYIVVVLVISNFFLDKFCRIYSVIMFKLSKFEDGAQLLWK